ncbi:MAG: antitoxin [Nanoarchaeota archaeon]
MTSQTVSARVELDEYTNRVLGVIKMKYGLKDKSEALNKFIELYGDEVIDREANEEYIKKTIELTKKHYNKYKNKKMTLQELDNLCEV